MKTTTLKWEPCSEENYPTNDEVCIVKVWDGAIGEYAYYFHTNCYLGWSTLIKRGAECAKFKK